MGPVRRVMLAGRLILLSLTLATAARFPTRVAGAPDWPRPAPVRELVNDARLFRPFAVNVSTEVDRSLAATPTPAGDVLARLLTLRVHLAVHLGDAAGALAAAARIRDTLVPPAERPFSGVLTAAFVAAQTAAPAGVSSPDYTPAFRSALQQRLAALPVTAEIATLLERQRDRFQSITREKLAAEAEVLGTRLDAMPRWPLDEVDHVVRLGHRLVTVLPVRETILRALEAAIAQRSPVPK